MATRDDVDFTPASLDRSAPTFIAGHRGIVSDATGFTGSTGWDTSKPDGTPRKLLDVSPLRTGGWWPTISLTEGVADTVSWYRSHQTSVGI